MPSAAFDLLTGFAGLFWPNVCACCSATLLQGEKYICSHCFHDLPVTHFHKDCNNPAAQLFWGRARVEYATSAYFFRKKNNVQKLIHLVKYKGQMELGAALGQQLGRFLSGTAFENVDLIVPVPLHPKKFRKRGYNQSEWIANGVAEILKKTVDTQTLTRRVFTTTQTTKNRIERWDNVENVFTVAKPESFRGKHLLIIDDVMTTGATLLSCANAALTAPESKVSVASIAFSAR